MYGIVNRYQGCGAASFGKERCLRLVVCQALNSTVSQVSRSDIHVVYQCVFMKRDVCWEILMWKSISREKIDHRLDLEMYEFSFRAEEGNLPHWWLPAPSTGHWIKLLHLSDEGSIQLSVSRRLVKATSDSSGMPHCCASFVDMYVNCETDWLIRKSPTHACRLQ